MADRDSLSPFWYVTCWPWKSVLLIFEAGYIYTSELVCS